MEGKGFEGAHPLCKRSMTKSVLISFETKGPRLPKVDLQVFNPAGGMSMLTGRSQQSDTNFIHRVVIFSCCTQGVEKTLLHSLRLLCHSVSFRLDFRWGAGP